jgi:hypothetical protein
LELCEKAIAPYPAKAGEAKVVIAMATTKELILIKSNQINEYN